jgi:hypothetical protein
MRDRYLTILPRTYTRVGASLNCEPKAGVTTMIYEFRVYISLVLSYIIRE